VTPSAQTAVVTGLHFPSGVAVDGAGDVFIADSDCPCVVKVTPGGVQTTVGSGYSGPPQSVAVDAAGDVFVVDGVGGELFKITPSGVQTLLERFDFPDGVAVDAAGDVFIADSTGGHVFELTPDFVQTTVGSGLYQPYGVAADGAGDVFISNNAFLPPNEVLEVNRAQPPSLTFNATDVGSTSSPQSSTIQNIGNQTLAAIAPGLTISTNFTQAEGSGTPADCTASFSLTPGTTCNLSISYAPTVTSPVRGMATLTDNSLNGNPATQSILLSGTGMGVNFYPNIPANPYSSAMVATCSGYQYLQFTATGLAPSTSYTAVFTLTSTCPGSSAPTTHTVNVTFTSPATITGNPGDRPFTSDDWEQVGNPNCFPGPDPDTYCEDNPGLPTNTTSVQNYSPTLGVNGPLSLNPADTTTNDGCLVSATVTLTATPGTLTPSPVNMDGNFSPSPMTVMCTLTPSMQTPVKQRAPRRHGKGVH
jgi:hypothetical protein